MEKYAFNHAGTNNDKTSAEKSIFERRRRLIVDLKACIASRNLLQGKSIHHAANQNGDDSNLHIASMLINMYAKCGSIDKASKVFDDIQIPDRVCWNTLIMGYVDNREPNTALDFFLRMHCQGYTIDDRTIIAALKACANIAAKDGNQGVIFKERGDALYLLACTRGHDSDIFLKNTLMDLYSKCRYLEDAQRVFNNIQHPDVISWTALVLAYAENGEAITALELFSRMSSRGCSPDTITFLAALKACSGLAEQEDCKVDARANGKRLHLLAMRSGSDMDPYVQGSLLDMYSKCGSMEYAHVVFKSMRHPDVVSWTVLIRGYADNGDGRIALEIFSRMATEGCAPDGRTFVAALKACNDLASEGAENEKFASIGKQIQVLVLRSGFNSDMFIQSNLVDLYAKCGLMSDANQVFCSLKYPDVVCWNALILAYAENEEGALALSYFFQMRTAGCSPDSRTFVSVIKGCSALAAKQGKFFDISRAAKLYLLSLENGFASQIFVQAALIDMFGKCGCMSEAHTIFDAVVHPNVICWTALMSGYADCGASNAVLGLFARMKREGCAPDEGTFVAVIRACGTLGALETGRAFHADIRNRGFEHAEILRNCLADFYAKCGCLAEAEMLFDFSAGRNLVTWNSLIAGYSRCGDTSNVFALFDRMQLVIQPDRITFVCVLSVCSHAGLVNKGKEYFNLMSNKFNTEPDIEHYNCMIDVLGRGNKLEDAMVLLRSMPIDPNAITWTTVLGACRKWKNVDLAKLAFESITSLDSENTGPYVLMANTGTM